MIPRPLSMLAGLRGGPIDEEDEPEEALDASDLNETTALIGMPLPPAPPCRHEALAARFAREASLGARKLRAEEQRHEGTKADLARWKRVSKRLGTTSSDARAKLAASEAEVKRLRRALARARRAASPRPSATPEPVRRPPSLGEIVDALTEVELRLDPCPF